MNCSNFREREREREREIERERERESLQKDNQCHMFSRLSCYARYMVFFSSVHIINSLSLKKRNCFDIAQIVPEMFITESTCIILL